MVYSRGSVPIPAKLEITTGAGQHYRRASEFLAEKAGRGGQRARLSSVPAARPQREAAPHPAPQQGRIPREETIDRRVAPRQDPIQK